jgi:hypothetical protein
VFRRIRKKVHAGVEFGKEPLEVAIDLLDSKPPRINPSNWRVVAGGKMRILVPARVICLACRARGTVGPYQCWCCEGRGVLTGEYPVTISYPADLQQEYMVRLPLDRIGIENFYLIVRFRPTEAIW